LNGISAFSVIFDTADVKILEEGPFSLESELSIHMGYKDDVDEVFSGEVLGFRGIFSESGSEQLEVTGCNILHKLNHASHFRSYEQKAPAAVIKELIEGYSLKAEVDDFGVSSAFVSEENRTDYEYLMELAGVYGKQIYAAGSTVYVKNEITVRQDEIIYEWGKSLVSLEVTHNIQELVSGVDFIGWDNLKNESFAGKAEMKDLPVKIGGSKDWTGVSGGGNGNYTDTKVDLNCKDTENAKQLALGVLQNNSFSFGYGQGVGEGNYKLRPGMRVTVKMAGETFEGEYMAQAVTHRIDRRTGYTTAFTLQRNMCI
jgi:phage protein D